MLISDHPLLTGLAPTDALKRICSAPPVLASYPFPRPPSQLRRALRNEGLIPATWDDVEAYLETPKSVPAKYAGEYAYNHYFAIAKPHGEMSRPRKGYKWANDNIAESSWLWADLDAPKVKDGGWYPNEDEYTLEAGSDVAKKLAEWREGALASLVDFEPRPAAIIDSGRGFWGFWALAEPITDHARLETALRSFVALLPDADSQVCDPSRVARLPGLPNSRTGWVASAYAVDGAGELSAADVDALIARAKPPETPKAEPLRGEVFGVAPELPKGKIEIHGGDNALLLGECLLAIGFGYRYNARRDRHEVAKLGDLGKPEIGWADAFGVGAGRGDETPDGWAPVIDCREVWLREEIRVRCRRLREIRSGPDKGEVKWLEVKIGASLFREGLDYLSAIQAVDPFVEWLNGLPDWDGEPRVDYLYWWAFGLGGEGASAEERDYYSAVARQTVLGAVGRAYAPGLAVPETPVLIGPEGSGKSLFARDLLPSGWRSEWFADDLGVGAGAKEFVERTAGTVIVEWSEMSGLRRRENEMTKALLTRTSEKGVRGAYQRHAADYPRRFVIIATANDEGGGVLPIEDIVGRRYAPVEAAEAADGWREWIAKNREQLWAQARDEWREENREVVSVPSASLTWGLGLREDARQTDEGASRIVDGIEEWARTGLRRGEGARLADMCHQTRILGNGGSGEYASPPTVAQVAAWLGASGMGVAKRLANELRRRGWARRQVSGGTRLWYPHTGVYEGEQGGLA